MATFPSPISSPPPSSSSSKRIKSLAKSCERGCCLVATYFPLAFVYGLSTWGIWVESNIGLGYVGSGNIPWYIKLLFLVDLSLYAMLNISYTIAVFTDPGSPLKSPAARNNKRGNYSILPVSEPGHDSDDYSTITVSSTGNARFCKKCHTPKPDRTHHCSTCKRCVLKMDHHCPWLATCLGLNNYKPFVLFLTYTSLFAWTAFGTTLWWLWVEMFGSAQYLEQFAPVSIILACVVGFILGLVLSGFTAWHYYLCIRGQTTIECLEKTRYLSKVRRQVERNRQDLLHHRSNSDGVAGTLQRAGEHILEFHANAIPGVTRYEEGEEHSSPAPSVHQMNGHVQNDYDTPAQRALRRNYNVVEQQRERDRYEEYLDGKDSEKLPNAFDLGWRKNLLHLFGPNPLFWFLPICNTTGDGWRWEVSEKWAKASEEAAQRKERRIAEAMSNNNVHLRGGSTANGYSQGYGYTDSDVHSPGAMSMQTLPRRNRQRQDFDQAEEGGERESFVVSSDEDSEDDYERR